MSRQSHTVRGRGWSARRRSRAALAAATVGAVAALLTAAPAHADTVVAGPYPGQVHTTSYELTGGFLVPQYKAVATDPSLSPYFYGHDQGAAQPSQPSWFTAHWYDLPPISPNGPDGSPILSDVQMAAPQESIDQFEGLTIPGQDYLLAGNPQWITPYPVSDPDLTYPLMWQFTGQGSLASCGTFAANVISQTLNDYSGSDPYRLAAQDVPTQYYLNSGNSADPGQSLKFTAEQAWTLSQKVTATLTSPSSVGFAGNTASLPTLAGSGSLGASEQESTAVEYDYTNNSHDEQYYWVSGLADYYTTIGVPYVFYKPATGGTVMAEYPNGLGPWFNQGTLPAGWTGNLGSWQAAQSDPGITTDTSGSFPWLSTGTCYVGQSLTLARILEPNTLGLHLMAQTPFGTQP